MNIGGGEMAKDTVEAIRQAEQKALQLEKDTALQQEVILQKAKEEAEHIVAAAVKEVLEIAKLDMEKAVVQGKKIMEDATNRAEKEILQLKERVKAKEPETLSLIVSSIIN